MTRADKVRCWTAVASLFRGVDGAGREFTEEAESGH
jgi:hypothetical protein